MSWWYLEGLTCTNWLPSQSFGSFQRDQPTLLHVLRLGPISQWLLTCTWPCSSWSDFASRGPPPRDSNSLSPLGALPLPSATSDQSEPSLSASVPKVPFTYAYTRVFFQVRFSLLHLCCCWKMLASPEALPTAFQAFPFVPDRERSRWLNRLLAWSCLSERWRP